VGSGTARGEISRDNRRHEDGGQCSRPFSASWPSTSLGHSSSWRGTSAAASISLGIDYAQGIGRVPV
jgi:hypothetical protein